jgi:hypothetical protein
MFTVGSDTGKTNRLRESTRARTTDRDRLSPVASLVNDDDFAVHDIDVDERLHVV